MPKHMPRIDKARHAWQPLRKATPLPPGPELVATTMQVLHCSREEAIENLMSEGDDLWINDLYQVQRIDYGKGLVQLNIRRRDGGPILRDWRHFQAIKNELLGEECEAVELYPAESRKVDLTNKFHLWGVKDPAYRFPFGWQERAVDYEGGKASGLRQRPL